jgi:hypothetical protein
MPQILARPAIRSVAAGRQGLAEAEPGPERHKAEDLTLAIAGARGRKARLAGSRPKPSDMNAFSPDSRLLSR